MDTDIKIAVIGLGYVGLPVALEFARSYQVMGFDIDPKRVADLQQQHDHTGELAPEQFEGCQIVFTHQAADLASCNVYVVAVPTPVDAQKVPDLNPLKSASEIVGSLLKKGDHVVYESTVYPGCTEEYCLPILEALSGLKVIEDFKIGYSPERINPGDKIHTLRKITKIVSGCDEASLDFIADLYSQIIDAGIFKATTIKVAESAKIIENTQRDVNIALMNELAMVFDKLGINTHDVLEAAGTKWNFLKFYPGLVGGHCIDIDPYYLTYKAQEVGCTPEVILSGRRVNSTVPKFIAKKIVQQLLSNGKHLNNSRVLVKGLTFKENISDCRNSRVFDLVKELELYQLEVYVQDPHVSFQNICEYPMIKLVSEMDGLYDVIIFAVAHKKFVEELFQDWSNFLNNSPIFFDVKSIHPELRNKRDITYISL